MTTNNQYRQAAYAMAIQTNDEIGYFKFLYQNRELDTITLALRYLKAVFYRSKTTSGLIIHP